MSVLSRRLTDLRNETGLSQTKAAEKIGVSQSTLASYELGRREPGYSVLCKLADFYSVTTDYLLGRSDDGTPHLTVGQQLLFQASANATDDEIRTVVKLLEALQR